MLDFEKIFSFGFKNLFLETQVIILLNLLLNDLLDGRIRIKQLLPKKFSNVVALAVSPALVNKKRSFIECAVICSDHVIAVESVNVVSDLVNVEAYIHFSGLHKNYLVYFT